MKMSKKWILVVVILIGICGYWLYMSSCRYEKNISKKDYDVKLISVNEWKEIKSCRTIESNLERVLSFNLKFSFLSEKKRDIPKIYHQETISFKEEGVFKKYADSSPSVTGLWNIDNDLLLVRDDESDDIWGGEMWFDVEKKIIVLTDNQLVLLTDGVFTEYMAQ
jgi:hypothetical protein